MSKGRAAKASWSWSHYRRTYGRAKRGAPEAAPAEQQDTSATYSNTGQQGPVERAGSGHHVAKAGGGRVRKAAECLPTLPDPVRPVAADRGKAGRIDLAKVPSGMEQAAEGWRDEVARDLGAHDRVQRQAAQAGQVLCRCGSRAANGKGSGLVPSWFGRDCIEADCPLRAEGGQ